MFESMKTKDNFLNTRRLIYIKWNKENVRYQIGKEFVEVELTPFEKNGDRNIVVSDPVSILRTVLIIHKINMCIRITHINSTAKYS